MVALDQDLMFGTFEVVSPLLHSHNDRQQFTVVHVAVLLGERALPRVERGRSMDAEAVKLFEDTGYRETACLRLKSDWLLRVEVLQDRRLGKRALKLLQGYLRVLGPLPLRACFLL
jgi:hypothetical protein